MHAVQNLNVAQYFKKKREEKGLSQLDLARLLGYKSAQIVSNWERNLCHPPLNRLYRLIKLLNLSRKEVMSLFLEETARHLESHIYKNTSKQKLRNANE